MTLMAREQIETFKREGAVVLRQFIAKAQVDEWLDEYWRFMQADADDPSTWPGTPLVYRCVPHTASFCKKNC